MLHLLSNFRTGISATYFEDIGDLVQLAVCRDICSSAFHLILLHFKLSILEVYAFLGHMMHLSLSPYLYHQLRSGPVSAPAFLVVSVNDSSIALALCVAFYIFGMGIFRARRFKINALEFAFPVFVGFVADSSTISYLLMCRFFGATVSPWFAPLYFVAPLFTVVLRWLSFALTGTLSSKICFHCRCAWRLSFWTPSCVLVPQCPSVHLCPLVEFFRLSLFQS